MKNIQLTKTEITQIQEFQSKYHQNILYLGELEAQLSIIEGQKQDLKNNIKLLYNQEKEFFEVLEKKYGKGTYDLEKGEFVLV